MTGKTAAHMTAATIAAAQAAGASVAPDVTFAPTVTPLQTLNMKSGTVLTVGAGMEFSTLNAALNASVNGDTIAVKAGTYVNDFCVVNTKVTILAMGGVVNEVGTVPPPNGKGIIVANNDLTIRGFTFTGASDGSPDGNVAGIRYEAGNLNVSYCCFHNMEDGLLATPNVVGTGNIAIDHSEFYADGTGDGYTHDIYIGGVASFTLTNSYIHDAIVGHEVKSRAAVTTITNNVIADGPTGTGSYDIDIPNAGVATITGNTIEKGPNASNAFAIHYGGETQYAWANNSLLINRNTIINDQPGDYAVLNQSNLNGLSVAAVFRNNSVYGFSAQNLIYGAGRIVGVNMLSSDPGFSTASPWTAVPDVGLSSGTQVLNLIDFGNQVAGGTALLSIDDTGGNNSIAGGSGGLRVTDHAGWDSITTASGAHDWLTLDGRNNTVNAAGHDSIVDNGMYDAINASGQASITGNSFASYTLGGADAVTVNGAGSLHVLASGQVSATIGVNGVSGEKDAGGALVVSGAGTASMGATVSGGSASFGSNNGSNFTLAGQHGALSVALGAGSFAITGGDGNDQFTTGSGTATLTLGAGNDRVTFGSGVTTVIGGSGAETYLFSGSSSGTATIDGFKQGVDSLTFSGGNVVEAGTITGGSTVLTLSDGATIDLAAVALQAYVGGGGSGGGTSTVGGASGSVTLTTGGQSVVGGAALLSVADLAGGNTIAGGTGGLMTAPIGNDVISTAAGSSNQLALTGSDTVTGAGSDHVAINGAHNDISESAAATLALTVWGNIVHGGAGLLTITDNFGGNTLSGGLGGLNAAITGASDVVTTAQGAADILSASGYSTLTLAGHDTATLTGNYNVTTATGTDVINADGGWSTFDLEGQDTMTGPGAGVITIGAHAQATLVSTGAGGSAITKLAGGTMALSQTMPDGSASSITVSGGAASAGSSGGNYAGISVTTAGAGDSITAGSGADSVTSAGPDTIWAGAGSLSVAASGALHLFGGSGQVSVTAGAAGVSVCGGAGNVTLTGGTGNDSFAGGTGSSVLWLGSGADSVTFGAGSSEIHAGASDMFTAIAGTGGHDTIYGFGGNDSFSFQGFNGSAVSSESVSGGNGFLTLTDGTSIELMGVTTLPHFA